MPGQEKNELVARTTHDVLKRLGYKVRGVLSGFDRLRQLESGLSLALIDVSKFIKSLTSSAQSTTFADIGSPTHSFRY
jgi:hypothetical protein